MDKKIVLICLVVGALVVAGCVVKKENLPKDSQLQEGMYKRVDIFRGNLSVLGTPSLNQTVDLIFTIKPMVDLSNVTIKIFLPESIDVISGNTEWHGDIKENKEIKLHLKLKVNQVGIREIRTYVESVFPNGHREYKCYYIYLHTSEKTGSISSHPLNVTKSQQQIPYKE
jgi:hypothetical protein